MKKSFLELKPEFCEAETALFHVTPIPYEESGQGRGAVDAVLDASTRLGRIDEKSRRPYWRPGVYTHEPIARCESFEREAVTIEETAKRLNLFKPGRIPIALGGDPCVSVPLIRVAAETYDDLSVVQFSAHSALNDVSRGANASVMTRVVDVVESVVQVGVRSFSEEELDRFPQQVDAFILPEDVENDFDAVVEKILWRASTNVYLTIDMDVFDPSVAPGVIAPEPGGLTWRQVVRLIDAIVAGKCLIGADVVGTVPLGGRNVVTEYTAARVVEKIMNAVTVKKSF